MHHHHVACGPRQGTRGLVRPVAHPKKAGLRPRECTPPDGLCVGGFTARRRLTWSPSKSSSCSTVLRRSAGHPSHAARRTGRRSGAEGRHTAGGWHQGTAGSQESNRAVVEGDYSSSRRRSNRATVPQEHWPGEQRTGRPSSWPRLPQPAGALAGRSQANTLMRDAPAVAQGVGSPCSDGSISPAVASPSRGQGGARLTACACCRGGRRLVGVTSRGAPTRERDGVYTTVCGSMTAGLSVASLLACVWRRDCVCTPCAGVLSLSGDQGVQQNVHSDLLASRSPEQAFNLLRRSLAVFGQEQGK